VFHLPSLCFQALLLGLSTGLYRYVTWAPGRLAVCRHLDGMAKKNSLEPAVRGGGICSLVQSVWPRRPGAAKWGGWMMLHAEWGNGVITRRRAEEAAEGRVR
jgi:hypothetical protein